MNVIPLHGTPVKCSFLILFYNLMTNCMAKHSLRHVPGSWLLLVRIILQVCLRLQ